MTANRLLLLETIPFVKTSYLETDIGTCPQKKLNPLAWGLQSHPYGNSTSSSSAQAPPDNPQSQEVLNISLIPWAMEPHSQRVSLQ